MGCAPKSSQRPAYRIVLSQCGAGGGWRQALLDGMNRGLIFHPEVQFRVVSSGDKGPEKQLAQIRALRPGEIDLLIVTPCGTNNITVAPAVQEIYDRGVPVVVLDQRVKTSRYS